MHTLQEHARKPERAFPGARGSSRRSPRSLPVVGTAERAAPRSRLYMSPRARVRVRRECRLSRVSIKKSLVIWRGDPHCPHFYAVASLVATRSPDPPVNSPTIFPARHTQQNTATGPITHLREAGRLPTVTQQVPLQGTALTASSLFCPSRSRRRDSEEPPGAVGLVPVLR